MSPVRQFFAFNRTVRVLLVNQLAVNTGFFLLYPYLAGYMADQLQLPVWMAGLVLGVGTLSQQGLFLVGGSLADRLGYRQVIVGGLAIRALGFLAYGFATELPTLLLAAFLSGFAGALFNPAVRAYLASSAANQRVEAFALFGVFANAGLLLGPLLGGVLIAFGFRTSSVVAALVFVCLTVIQAWVLPRDTPSPAEHAQSVMSDWREVISNRPFVVLSVAMLGYFALYVQFYLGLPLAARQVTGDDSGIGAIFVLSAVVGIVAQVPLTRFGKRRWQPPRAIAVGLLVMGAAFLPLLFDYRLMDQSVLARLGGVSPEFHLFVIGWLSLLPVLLATALLMIGSLLAQPFAMDLVADLSGGRLVGTYFGVYYLTLGIGGAGGQVLAGLGFDLGQRLNLAALPWLLLLAIAAISALGVVIFERGAACARRASPQVEAVHRHSRTDHSHRA
jgi:MFS family permease